MNILFQLNGQPYCHLNISNTNMSIDIIGIWINIPNPNLQSVLHTGRWLTPCPHTSQMLLLIQLWRDGPQ